MIFAFINVMVEFLAVVILGALLLIPLEISRISQEILLLVVLMFCLNIRHSNHTLNRYRYQTQYSLLIDSSLTDGRTLVY